MKKILILSILLAVFSCTSVNGELEKTAKAGAASNRINSSEQNNRDIFKEME